MPSRAWTARRFRADRTDQMIQVPLPPRRIDTTIGASISFGPVTDPMTTNMELIRAAVEGGNLKEAERLCLAYLEDSPDDASARLLLARIQAELSKLDDAIESYQRAGTLDPELIDTRYLVELSALLHTTGRRDESVALLRQAVQQDPDSFHCWYNLGSVLLDLRDEAEAVAALEHARRLEPDSPDACQNLGQAFYGIGEIDQAIAAYADAERLGQGQASALMLALAWPQSSRATDESILKMRRAWSADQLPPLKTRDFSDRKGANPNRPLRVGYLSSYFHHRNWMKPVWGLINRLDRNQYSVALFSHAPEEPLTSGYVTQPGDQLHHVAGLSNEQLAGLMIQEKVDILIDLNGYSEVNRLALFPLRPAPVAATWFNSFATSGIPGIDYLIGDPVVIRPREESHYSERIARVDHCYLTFEVFGTVPDVAPPPCEQTDVFTYGSLGTLYKVSAAVYSVWAEILKQVPKSQFLFRNSGLVREGNRRFVKQQFADRGIDPDRIMLEGPAPHTEFLKTYDRIDLALDTFPYTGGTTTSEALWQGVPMLTLTGDRWLPRVSESILRAAGLTDFIANKASIYIRKAVEMATPSGRKTLAGLRSTLRQRVATSPLGNCDSFTRNMESLYRRMWHAWLDGSSR